MVFVMSFPRQTAYLLGTSEHLLPMVRTIWWFVPSLTFQMDSRFAVRDPLDGRSSRWCIVSALINVVLIGCSSSAGLGVMGAAFATSVCIVTGG